MRFACFLLTAGFSAGLMTSQLTAQSTQTDLSGIPTSSGIYWHAPSGWIGLPANPLLAFEGSNVRWLLSLGRNDAVAEIPGPHSVVQIPNARPVLHLRGFLPDNAIYVVRETEKLDYREIRMPITHDFHNWARFRSQDLVDYTMTRNDDGIATLTPKADMKPGDYAVVTQYEPGMRGIRIAFDFGVTGK